MSDEVKSPTDIHDLVVVGAGPASLSASLYTTREDIETLVYDKGPIGGLAAVTDWIDNYPGFPEGVSGLELSDRLEKQAVRFGAKIEYGEVTSMADKGTHKELIVDGQPVKARSVLIATGTAYRKINVAGEDEYLSKGVHYCATCDGAFYRDKRLIVVGGGNSAFQESLFLTRFATRIDMLVRSEVKASDVLQKEVANSPKITIHTGVRTDEIIGNDGHVTSVKGFDNNSNKPISIETDGVFVFVGLDPNTQFLKGSGVELDKRRFVKTDERLETAVPGVFAAGDCRSGATMQIATATGEGATAALMVREYLEAKAKA